jgi:hypothetical protein
VGGRENAKCIVAPFVMRNWNFHSCLIIALFDRKAREWISACLCVRPLWYLPKRSRTGAKLGRDTLGGSRSGLQQPLRPTPYQSSIDIWGKTICNGGTRYDNNVKVTLIL